MMMKNDQQLRQSTARPFNLIEITLALGVIAIGIVAILGLFPVGANASRDAMGQTTAAQTADEMLAFIEQTIRACWPLDDAAWDALLPDTDNKPTPETDMNNFESSAQPGTNGMIYAHQTDAGQYRLIRFVNVDGVTDGNGDAVYNEATDIKDFDAVMILWRSQVDVAGTDIEYDYAVGINAELTWPAGIPLQSRERKAFYLELFNR